MASPPWFTGMLGWKPASQKTSQRCLELFGVRRGPNLADLSSPSSAAIAGAVLGLLGVPDDRLAADIRHDSPRSKSAGSALERAIETDLRVGLPLADPNRDWQVGRSGAVSQFAQYHHLAELQLLFEQVPTLRSTLAQDYQVSTDVMVSLPSAGDLFEPRVLHAAVSSKLTIRSDRVQNIRFEFNMLVRNRKGRAPHLVVVTAEPLPSRLVSIARGTGEIDAVYHLMFDELDQISGRSDLRGVTDRSWRAQQRDWRELVDQHRIRPYSDLVPVLAAG